MNKNGKKDIFTKIVKKILKNLQFIHLGPDPDPGPVTQINEDPFGSRSETLFFVFPEHSRLHLHVLYTASFVN
jgi:hypothetical protein